MKVASLTEITVLREIVAEHPNEPEFTLVVSAITNGKSMARSIGVNALRLAEASGIITTWSVGMKGTHVRVDDLDRWALLGLRCSTR